MLAGLIRSWVNTIAPTTGPEPSELALWAQSGMRSIALSGGPIVAKPGAPEQAEEAGGHEHQARRLGDEGGVNDTGAARGPVAAHEASSSGAAGHVDGGSAGFRKTTRPKQDRHLAATATSTGGDGESREGLAGELAATTPTAPGGRQAPESSTESAWRKMPPPLPPPAPNPVPSPEIAGPPLAVTDPLMVREPTAPISIAPPPPPPGPLPLPPPLPP